MSPAFALKKNPLSKERAAFQEWKNTSESLYVSQAILHFFFFLFVWDQR